jgi:hypothetical protein
MGKLFYAFVLALLVATTVMAQAVVAADCQVISDLSIGQLVIFLTTVAGFLHNSYRESRKRRWDLEDRRLARAEADRKIEIAARDLAMTTRAAHADLGKKIDENTQISHDAFKQANAVNEKIAMLARKFTQEDNHARNRRSGDK